MCGFVGIAFKYPPNQREILVKANEQLSHRGPNSEGYWWSKDGRIGLGHKRLSILDLSKNGNQPMISKSKRFSIVFNGEIYNHLFLKNLIDKEKKILWKGSSDTEVLIECIELWGLEKSLNLVEGMYSFALFDNLKNNIFLVRDIAGEKPLFYKKDELGLVFASELKALMVLPNNTRKIDMDSLAYYLHTGFVPGNKSILEGYKKLRAGHFLVFNIDTKEIKEIKYWELPEKKEYLNNKEINSEYLTYKLEKILKESIKKQIYADVPVGVLLSGGIDSSLITAIAKGFKNDIKTFTITFPNNKFYDESEHSRFIAKNFETEHFELEANSINQDTITNLIKYIDEPIGDSSIIPTFLVSQAVSKECKVVLGGDGGDELFGGYSYYRKLIYISSLSGILPQFVRNRFRQFAERKLRIGFRGRSLISLIGNDFKKKIPFLPSFLDEYTLKRVLKEKSLTLSEKAFYTNNSIEKNNLIDSMTRRDFKEYLSEDILVKVDRTSMANSLEIRAPFLHKKIVDFAYSEVPASLKVSYMDQKILLKKLCDKILPKEFSKNRKQGFSVPLRDYFNDPSIRELFFEPIKSKNSIFDKEMIQQIISSQNKGYSNSQNIFALSIFEMWRDKFNAYL